MPLDIKDHIYRMVIVEGCCTMARSPSFRSKLIIGWHKSIVSSDWSDTMVWFGQILLYIPFFYHPIYMIIGQDWHWRGANMCVFGISLFYEYLHVFTMASLVQIRPTWFYFHFMNNKVFHWCLKVKSKLNFVLC